MQDQFHLQTMHQAFILTVVNKVKGLIDGQVGAAFFPFLSDYEPGRLSQ